MGTCGGVLALLEAYGDPWGPTWIYADLWEPLGAYQHL